MGNRYKSVLLKKKRLEKCWSKWWHCFNFRTKASKYGKIKEGFTYSLASNLPRVFI